MKRSTTILFLFFAATCLAGVRDELAKTKEASIRSWSGIRDAILAIGPSATNDLAHSAADENLDWRERFMANVCLERLSNGNRRDNFFKNPVRDDPERDPGWIVMATGYAREEIPLVEKRLVENGFWFGVLESFASMDSDPGTCDPIFGASSVIIDDVAPLEIRRTAARIAEVFTIRFMDGVDEYVGSRMRVFKRYVKDGTYPEGVETILRLLASQKNCSYVELEDIVERTGDIDLLESLIPCFSNHPPKVWMIRRRIDQLCESSAPKAESHPAFNPGPGQAEREEEPVPVIEKNSSSESGPNDKRHPRSRRVFARIVLVAVLAAFLFFFRRLFSGSGGKGRGFLLVALVALTGAATVRLLETVANRFADSRSWERIFAEERIIELNSETRPFSQTTDMIPPRTSTDEASSRAANTNVLSGRILPSGVIFRGQSRAPDN